MKAVVAASPWKAADQITADRNREYALRVMADSLARGEAPFLSHLLYTQILDDSDIEDRRLGLFAESRWIKKADKLVVYQDYGTSKGMKDSIAFATDNAIAVEYRSIGINHNPRQSPYEAHAD